MLIVICIFLHPFIASYTSLLKQSIIINDHNLKSAPNARLAHVNSLLGWFQRAPPMYALNVAAYTLCAVFYGVIAYQADVVRVTLSEQQRVDASAAVVQFRPAIIATVIIVLALDAFLLINLGIGMLRRAGSFDKCKLNEPLNSASYAAALNHILAECKAGFTLNAKCVRTGASNRVQNVRNGAALN